MPRAKKGQQKVPTLKKKTTGLCPSRCYCSMQCTVCMIISLIDGSLLRRTLVRCTAWRSSRTTSSPRSSQPSWTWRLRCPRTLRWVMWALLTFLRAESAKAQNSSKIAEPFIYIIFKKGEGERRAKPSLL